MKLIVFIALFLTLCMNEAWANQERLQTNLRYVTNPTKVQTSLRYVTNPTKVQTNLNYVTNPTKVQTIENSDDDCAPACEALSEELDLTEETEEQCVSECLGLVEELKSLGVEDVTEVEQMIGAFIDELLNDLTSLSPEELQQMADEGNEMLEEDLQKLATGAVSA